MFLVGTYLDVLYAASGSTDWRVSYLTGQLNLGREKAVSAWYSSLVLLTVAMAAAACFFVERPVLSARGGFLAYAWWLIVAAFTVLSLDELGSLHERFGELPGANPFSGTLVTWVGVFAIPVIAVAIFFLLFAWSRLRLSRAAFLLFVAGILLFVSVPVQEQIEFELAKTAADSSSSSYKRPASHLVLEEGAELMGSLCFLSALVLYGTAVIRRNNGRQRTDHELVWRPTLREALVLYASVLVLLIALRFGVAMLMSVFQPMPARGNPATWFPLVLTAIAACISGYMWTEHSLWRSGRRPFWPVALALFGLCISMDFAASGFLTDTLWRGKPFAAAVVTAGLIVGALVLAACACRQLVTTFARAGMVVWAFAVVVGFTLRRPIDEWAVLMGFAVLIPSMLIEWAALSDRKAE